METETIPPSIQDRQEEAKGRLDRAFRVKFNREPERAAEQTLILLAKQAVAEGQSFRWTGTADDPDLRLGLQEEEGVSLGTSNDLMNLEAEHSARAEEAISEYGKQLLTNPEEKQRGPIMPKLTHKEAMFCRFVASGLNQVTSFWKAGYTASSQASAYSCASQIAARPHVSIYLRTLKESSYLADVLTLAEKRKGLADAWRTPVGEVDENHPLAQEVTIKEYTDKEGNVTGTEKKVKMVGKLEALKLDAQLAGELKEQSAAANTFNFTMLSASMDMPEAVADAYVVENLGEALPE